METIIGKQVILKPEYQDRWQYCFSYDKPVFRAIDEMEKGRVTVVCELPGFSIPPTYVIKDYMIESIK